MQLVLTGAGASSVSQSLRQRAQQEDGDFIDEQCGSRNTEDHLRDPPRNLISLWYLGGGIPYAWVGKARRPHGDTCAHLDRQPRRPRLDHLVHTFYAGASME